MYYVDALTDAASGVITVTKGIPVVDWGEHDFNVNGTFQVDEIDQPHIVAEGDSGVWHYKKWSNNYAECFGIPAAYVGLTTSAGGSMYRTDDIMITLPTGLFAALKEVQLTSGVSSDAVFTAYWQKSKSDNTKIVFRFGSSQAFGAQWFDCSAHIIGLWS